MTEFRWKSFYKDKFVKINVHVWNISCFNKETTSFWKATNFQLLYKKFLNFIYVFVAIR